jgi:hypothetical protein
LSATISHTTLSLNSPACPRGRRLSPFIPPIPLATKRSRHL